MQNFQVKGHSLVPLNNVANHPELPEGLQESAELSQVPPPAPASQSWEDGRIRPPQHNNSATDILTPFLGPVLQCR